MASRKERVETVWAKPVTVLRLDITSRPDHLRTGIHHTGNRDSQPHLFNPFQGTDKETPFGVYKVVLILDCSSPIDVEDYMLKIVKTRAQCLHSHLNQGQEYKQSFLGERMFGYWTILMKRQSRLVATRRREQPALFFRIWPPQSWQYSITCKPKVSQTKGASNPNPRQFIPPWTLKIRIEHQIGQSLREKNLLWKQGQLKLHCNTEKRAHQHKSHHLSLYLSQTLFKPCSRSYNSVHPVYRNWDFKLPHFCKKCF